MKILHIFLLGLIATCALAGILLANQMAAQVDNPNPSPSVRINP